MISFVSKDDLLFAYNSIIKQGGGIFGIRDDNLLESSLAHPKHLYHYSDSCIFDIASSYAYSLTRNHPFIDGNKRVAYVTMRLFLQLNTYDIMATDKEKIDIMLSLAKGDIAMQELSAWLANNTFSNGTFSNGTFSNGTS